MTQSNLEFTRRQFVVATLLPLAYGCRAYDHRTEDDTFKVDRTLQEFERQTAGRIGVAALNLNTGAQLGHRVDERFAMCSTFKWLLAAAVLHRVDSGEESLDRSLSWTAEDLVTWSPVTQPAVESSADGTARLTLGQLCQATMRTSDNTAANIVLKTIGGPSGLTRILRSFGDTVTRLDRWEPELNANTPGDPRDTTTPAAMLSLMQRLLYAQLLTDRSRQLLKTWLVMNETGSSRLRAGLPDHWTVGDRTGTSTNDANNNIAFAEAPSHNDGRGPLLIVSFTNAPNPTSKAMNTHHAQLAQYLFERLIN